MAKSYYLYQKYEKRGNQPFHPSYPVEYSVDGNGTMQKILKMEDDPNCNSVDNTIYQWVEVTGEYECSGTTKCQKEKEQRSDDFGMTWRDTGNYRAGAVIEYNSEDCGWQPPQYRTVSGEPYCNGYTKMVDTYNQVSNDGGTTWENTGVSGSTVIEYNSPECGYPIYQWVDTDGYVCEGDYYNEYITFNILTGGTIEWKGVLSDSASQRTISYSINNGGWFQITSTSAGTSFNVSAGDKVRFRGNNATYGYTEDGNHIMIGGCKFGGTAYFNVSGNIMSLVSGDSFDSASTLSIGYNFYNLFSGSNIVSAENLILPATTLAERCYSHMFIRCASLTKSPALPATTLEVGCYDMMFEGCTSLTTAPELPATMLQGGCYERMFYGCSSLNYIKCLALSCNRYYGANFTTKWVYGTSNSGTFVKTSETPTGINKWEWTTGDNGIPTGWTVQNAS